MSEPTAARRGIRWLPLVMLLALGAVWGGNPSFSKAITGAGIAPSAAVFWQAALAGLVLLAICRLRGTAIPLDRKALVYYAAIGMIGIDLAYINMVFVVGHLSASFVSVVTLLSPVLTYLIALALRMERVALLRAFGIALGFAGAAILVLPDGSLPTPEALPYALLAFVTPAAYAFANIFAERGRPAGADNVALAAGTMFAAALAAGALSLAFGNFHPLLESPGTGDLLLAGYALATAVGFLLFYAIISMAGAVYLGQVGNIVTLAGVGWGVLFFGETTTIWLWVAIAVVALGVGLVNFGKRERASPAVAGARSRPADGGAA